MPQPRRAVSVRQGRTSSRKGKGDGSQGGTSGRGVVRSFHHPMRSAVQDMYCTCTVLYRMYRTCPPYDGPVLRVRSVRYCTVLYLQVRYKYRRVGGGRKDGRHGVLGPGSVGPCQTCPDGYSVRSVLTGTLLTWRTEEVILLDLSHILQSTPHVNIC